MPLGNYKLRNDDPDKREQLLKSVPGMAYFACTGPTGTTCGECRFLLDVGDGEGKYKRSRCQKYQEMMHGTVGERVETMTPSCKYFEPRPRRSK